MNMPRPNCPLDIPKTECRSISHTLTCTKDSGSASSMGSSLTGTALPNMRASMSLRSFSASSFLRTMKASAEDAFTLELRLKESLVAPRMRHTASLSTFTEASLSYCMRVSERIIVERFTTSSSSRK